MKFLLPIILCIVVNFQLSAQEPTYFNEWIDYEKEYHKFYIEEDGLYRISYDALQTSGLAAKGTEGLHLFSRGQEIPIYIPPTSDVLSDNYIEFYATQNDGSFDTQLFADSDGQLTDQRSLYTNTSAYYLMWDDGFEGLRIESNTNILDGTLPEKEPFFLHKENLIHNNVFHFGTPTRISGLRFYFSDFEKGEGFTSPLILETNTRTYSLNTFGVYQEADAPDAFLQTKLVGQSDYPFVEAEHHMELSINGKVYLDEIFAAYDTPHYEAAIAVNDLNSDSKTDIIYHSVGGLVPDAVYDLQSVAYTFLIYPREFDFSTYQLGEIVDAQEFYFEFQDLDETYFEVTHFNGSNSAILYDLTNGQRYTIELDGDTYKIHLPQSTSMTEESRRLFLNNGADDFVQTIESLESLQFTDYSQTINQGNYLLISHPSLRTGDTDWVKEYADYRSSQTGGNYEVVLADIEGLYDQFSHGIRKHPLSIRHFISYALDNWEQSPEYLFLMGKGITYRSTVTPQSFNDNLIPTVGHQASDFAFVTKELGDYQIELGIGRLSAQTPTDVEDYFNKVQAYETIDVCGNANELWRKQTLFQASGDTEEDAAVSTEYVENYVPLIESNSFNGKVLDIQGHRNYSSEFNTEPFLEQGIGLLLFMGQSTGLNWKTDIKENAGAYNQITPRFPFILSSAPFVGNQFKSTNSSTSMAEHWVGTKDQGAIGFLGKINFHYPTIENVLYKELIQKVTQSNYNQPIGKSIKESIDAVYLDSDEEGYTNLKASILSHSYEGDPAIVLGSRLDAPDYSIENGYAYSSIEVLDGISTTETKIRNDVEIYHTDGQLIEAQNEIIEVDKGEDLQLSIRVSNLGKGIEGSFNIEVSRQLMGTEGKEIIEVQNFDAPFYDETYTIALPYLSETQTEELYTYFVRIDADNGIEEVCEDNNEVSLQIRFLTCLAEISEIEVNPNEEIASLSISGEFAEYLWNTGETTPTITVTANGTYTLTVTDTNGCIATSSVDVFVTNIEEALLSHAIRAYPNPVESELLIEGKELRGFLLQLYDVQGRILFSKYLQKDSETLDMKTLQSGLYILQLTNQEGVWSQKVVKE